MPIAASSFISHESTIYKISQARRRAAALACPSVMRFLVGQVPPPFDC